MKTVKHARKFVQNNLEAGVVCPCCDKIAKEQRYKIAPNAAASLILLVKLYKKNQRFYFLDEFAASKRLLGNGMTAHLVYWGLTKRMEKESPLDNYLGFYIPTEKGIAFAESKITLPKYLICYNKIPLRMEGEQLSIRDALNNKFCLAELIKGKNYAK